VYGREKRVLLREYLEQGLTKTALAVKLGISRRTIHHWVETGQLEQPYPETRTPAGGLPDSLIRRNASGPFRLGMKKSRTTTSGQSLDGFSFFGYTLYDSLDTVLASDGFVSIPALPNGSDGTSLSSAGGSIFLGFVSDSSNVARIDFSEFDANAANPDANVGYDTFRFGARVPEPSSLVLLALGLAGLMAKPRRR
jgi:hypothetical protein